jgi:ATP-dependent DNA helicase RecG
MSTDLKQNIGDAFREGTRIDRALEAARLQAIVRHKQSGQPMPIWRDGKTTMISAEELEERLNVIPDNACRRIFIPTLSFGKRVPEYVGEATRVTLRIFDGTFDERMARLMAKWRGEGREIDLDVLLVLSYLTGHAFIDTLSAADVLQLTPDQARGVLDRLAQPQIGILERMGRTRAATFHLTKGVAEDLLGRAAYTRLKGIDPIRYREWAREFVEDHGSITPRECRELLGLGESASAQVAASRYLKEWSAPTGFLVREGRGPSTRYRLRAPMAPAQGES